MSEQKLFQEISIENTRKNIIFKDQQIQWNHKQEILIHNLEVENQKLHSVIFLCLKI